MEPIAIKSHGIILGTEKFEECVAFYRDIIGLPVWFVKHELVCLRFGDGYLMIETGGVSSACVKSNAENPTMIRFNVEDVEQAAAMMKPRGVAVEVTRYPWGTVGTFVDPDGNKVEFKNADDPYFT